jgi:hypothetical protein
MKLCWATKNNQVYSSKDDTYAAKREEENKIRDAWTSAVNKELTKVLPPKPDWESGYWISRSHEDKVIVTGVVNSRDELNFELELPEVEWLVTDPVEVAKIALERYTKGEGYVWCGR